MAKITAITQQKRTSRVNIFIDEKFAFGVSKKTMVDFDLCKDKILTEKGIKEILEKDQLIKALEKSFRLLGIRPRSQQELEKKLKEKEFDPKIIKKTIKRVKELGYLDDVKFAKAWLEARKFSHKGKYIVQQELKQKGVAEETIKKTIAQYKPEQEYEIALELARKKMKTLEGKTSSQPSFSPRKSAPAPHRIRSGAGFSQRSSAFLRKQKLAAFLANRGFSWEIITKVLTEF